MPERTRALAALLRGLVDYAGLFPPAAHNMSETVARYARYRREPDAAALGRIVVPAARLMEWEQAAAALPAGQRGAARWNLTALLSPGARHELEAVAAFNRRESAGHDLSARVESVEVKVSSADEIRRVASETPSDVEVFYECAPGGPSSPLLAEVAGVGGGAKIRTGGLVPGSVPAPGAVAQFLHTCVSASVPFKATAGLHHAVRATYALTYEPDSPRDVMFGFLNVFVAAVLAHACGLDVPALIPILDERSAEAFVFTDTHLSWRDLSADVDQVRSARQVARGFGSCSFEEPIGDLKAMLAYL